MISLNLPKGSFFRPASKLFTADFNTPELGKYSFNVTANENVDVIGINPSNLYFFSIMNFGATIPESTYLENLEVVPTVDFHLKQSGTQLFGQGYPLTNYLKNNEISAFFWSRQEKDFLVGTFRGLLGQNGSLAGIPAIIATVAVNIFEITDQKFISDFFSDPAATTENNSLTVPDAFKDRV